jgi:hypothetical protein
MRLYLIQDSVAEGSRWGYHSRFRSMYMGCIKYDRRGVSVVPAFRIMH